jgi:hypothetical protein
VGNDGRDSANGFATASARNTPRLGVRTVTSRYDDANETVRSVTTQHTEFWLDRTLKVAARVRIPLRLRGICERAAPSGAALLISALCHTLSLP